MSKFTGNIIRLPAVTPTQNSASGVYTLDDQFTAQSSGTWPIVRDQYFNYTTLLLTGAVQGTAYPNPVTQPYSFLSDASTNNFVVSPNGDVSARPFNPYLNSYSNFFSGSGQYLTATNSSAFYLSTGNFTVEAWIYRTAASSGNAKIIVGQTQNTGVPYAGWLFYVTSSDFLRFEGSNGSAVTASITVPLNQWVHVAAVRASSTTTIYMNGVPLLSGSVSITDFSGLLTIGQYTSAFSGPEWIGYISNLRIVKGTAVYTSSFTPPTQPLQNISGTSLLTCQSNRFIDNSTANSGSGFPITVTGSPAVSQNSPFVSYDTTNGSGYFDGTGDYLTAPSNIVDFAAGQAFTVECWVYVSSNTPGQAISANGANAFSLVISGGQVLYGKSGVIDLLVGTMAAANQWVHIAVGRNSSNTSRLWVNGNSVATSGSDTYSFNAATTYIGANSNPGAYLNGYMASLRVVKGTDVYGVANTSIPVPTAPLTPVSGTSLLTLQTRAPATNNGFIDSSPNNFVVTRNGNTTQGSFSPFSPTGWSNYFGGANNLSIAQTTALDLGSGNFTVEAWIYPLNFSGNQRLIAKQRSSDGYGWIFRLNSSTGYLFLEVDTGGVVTSTSAPSLNTWSHVAAVRNGNVVTLYLNGSAVGSNNSYSGSPTSVSATAYIGSSAGGEYFSGYISNIRFTKGQAFASGAFTPPTSMIFNSVVGWTGTNVPTQSITGSVGVLTCQSNRFKDNSPNNFTLTPTSTLSVQAFSPFAPAQSYIPSQIGGSGYFDGTTDYLSVADSASFDLGATNWTIELWAYFNSVSGEKGLVTHFAAGTPNAGYTLRLSTSNSPSGLRLVCSGSSDVVLQAAWSPVVGTWYHIAAVRNGGTLYTYVDGQQIGSTSIAITIGNPSALFGVGTAQTVASSDFNGYISNARLVKGTAVYTGNFTPPTKPLAASGADSAASYSSTTNVNTSFLSSECSLLLNFTNGGIVDATGKNNLETVANSGVQTTVIKYGNGSMYFDGTGDYLTAKDNPDIRMGTANFTIECWVYVTGGSSYRAIISKGAAATGWLVFIDATGTWSFALTSTNYVGSIAMSLNTWTHLAFVRTGNNFVLYANAVQSVAQTISVDLSQTEQLVVGANRTNLDIPLTGYISNLRITKGIARYSGSSTSTPNFTLPPGPFPLG